MKCYDLAKARRTLRIFRISPLRSLRLGEKYISRKKISARKKSRKGAKDAKINSEYLLARLVAWREIYITKKYLRERTLAKALRALRDVCSMLGYER